MPDSEAPLLQDYPPLDAAPAAPLPGFMRIDVPAIRLRKDNAYVFAEYECVTFSAAWVRSSTWHRWSAWAKFASEVEWSAGRNQRPTFPDAYPSLIDFFSNKLDGALLEYRRAALQAYARTISVAAPEETAAFLQPNLEDVTALSTTVAVLPFDADAREEGWRGCSPVVSPARLLERASPLLQVPQPSATSERRWNRRWRRQQELYAAQKMNGEADGELVAAKEPEATPHPSRTAGTAANRRTVRFELPGTPMGGLDFSSPAATGAEGGAEAADRGAEALRAATDAALRALEAEEAREEAALAAACVQRGWRRLMLRRTARRARFLWSSCAAVHVQRVWRGSRARRELSCRIGPNPRVKGAERPPSCAAPSSPAPAIAASRRPRGALLSGGFGSVAMGRASNMAASDAKKRVRFWPEAGEREDAPAEPMVFPMAPCRFPPSEGRPSSRFPPSDGRPSTLLWCELSRLLQLAARRFPPASAARPASEGSGAEAEAAGAEFVADVESTLAAIRNHLLCSARAPTGPRPASPTPPSPISPVSVLDSLDSAAKGGAAAKAPASGGGGGGPFDAASASELLKLLLPHLQRDQQLAQLAQGGECEAQGGASELAIRNTSELLHVLALPRAAREWSG